MSDAPPATSRKHLQNCMRRSVVRARPFQGERQVELLIPWIGLIGLIGLAGLAGIKSPVARSRPGAAIRLLGILGLAGLSGIWIPGAGAMGAFGALGLWNHQSDRLALWGRLGWTGLLGLPFALAALA
jgi:hypothetical protein